MRYIYIIHTHTPAFGVTLFTQAVAAAKASDIAVVMVGLCADHCAGHGRTENEGNDRGPGGSGWHTLGLPGAQQQLLEAVVQAQPNTVLVMINGGMMSISWAKEHVPAILEAYYPGQLGGDAIVNTLLGHNNPGGKTPVTWYPESITSRDIHDMDLNSGEGLTHLYYTGEVLWPFGFGLSYTTFTYTWADEGRVSSPVPHSRVPILEIMRTGVRYRCTVQNTGAVTGDAVVLGFVNSTDPQFPRQKLFDFARVTLTPGASETVMLTLNADHLSVVSENGRVSLRPAQFTVRVGDVLVPATHTFEMIGSSEQMYDYTGVF